MNGTTHNQDTTAEAVVSEYRSERITRANVEARVENLNRRMEARGSIYRYQVQGRNGYTALDRFYRDTSDALGMSLRNSVPGRGAGWICHSTVTVGTKREVAEWLHAAMIALDDAACTAESGYVQVVPA